jgi:hypothetical protein
MKIKIGNVELSDWYSDGSIKHGTQYWARYCYFSTDSDSDVSTTISIHINTLAPTQCYVNFYQPLAFLHDYFTQDIEGDLEFSKIQVDNFLIRMSGLTAFL